MSDKELLELAAKAAGNIEYFWTENGNLVLSDPDGKRWNPLTDDGDALRLAVRRGIEVRNFNGKSHAGRQGHFWCTEDWFPDGDQYAATRRAIVRAAAAVGASQMTSPIYNICTRCGRKGHCAASCKENKR